jgi:uncharacterized repeat protein (TIGR02543 family)
MKKRILAMVIAMVIFITSIPASAITTNLSPGRQTLEYSFSFLNTTRLDQHWTREGGNTWRFDGENGYLFDNTGSLVLTDILPKTQSDYIIEFEVSLRSAVINSSSLSFSFGGNRDVFTLIHGSSVSAVNTFGISYRANINDFGTRIATKSLAINQHIHKKLHVFNGAVDIYIDDEFITSRELVSEREEFAFHGGSGNFRGYHIRNFKISYETDVHSIAYNLNGGTNPASVPNTYISGLAIDLPTPTRTGHTFDGWYTNSNFTGTGMTSTGETISGNLNLHARWTENRYAVIFDSNLGSEGGFVTATPTQNITHDGRITRPQNPSRRGYNFGGWYQEAACTREWNFNTTITAPVTLYAKWTPIPGRILGEDTVSINDALEVLKHLAGISTLTGDALNAARIITPGIGAPTINDVLEILKHLAGLPSKLD